MSQASLQKGRWLHDYSHGGPIVWAIVLGTLVILVALFMLAQQIVFLERCITAWQLGAAFPPCVASPEGLVSESGRLI